MNLLHVIQHTSADYLGLMEDHLEGRRIRFRYFRPFTEQGTVPQPGELCDGLILLGGGPWGNGMLDCRIGGTYEKPFAISKDRFLVSKNGRIQLRDFDANAVFILFPRDGMGFYSPMPIRETPRPAVVAPGPPPPAPAPEPEVAPLVTDLDAQGPRPRTGLADLQMQAGCAAN